MPGSGKRSFSNSRFRLVERERFWIGSVTHVILNSPCITTNISSDLYDAGFSVGLLVRKFYTEMTTTPEIQSYLFLSSI